MTATATFTYFVLNRESKVIFKTASKSQAYKEYENNPEAVSVLRRPD